MAVAESEVRHEAVSADPILEVSGLRAGFGSNAVLHGVDLEVPAGKITAILGLNGAGKSVTLKTISGLVPAWGGTIRFEGRDITQMETEDRVALGMSHVLQGRAVFPHLTIAQNLRLGGAVLKNKAASNKSEQRIYETFPRLRERRDQLAGTLSGGEQEMLAVGRALMSSPKLVLVDEASQGLAPQAVAHLFEVLKQVNETGVTMLVVEQNVTFTLGIADRVLVMQKGQIVYTGESGELDRGKLASLLGIGALLGAAIEAKQEEPAEQEAVELKARPVAKKAVARKPVAKKVGAKTNKVVAKKPAVKKPSAKKPAAKKPAAKKTVAKKPAAKSKKATTRAR